ncbi:MAG: zf-HC2 domain-containing protein [Oscillospiraceae bacterium]|nr:zf-HC2 domain-containing protein [Oscillospiraceae bacterium]
MRTCEDVREAVSAWLDGELDPQFEAGMLEHTSDCEDCRSFLEICRVMSDDLTLDEAPLPGTLIPGVMRRLAEERQTAEAGAGNVRTVDRRRTYRRIAAWACAAACLALVIIAGPWNWRAGSSGSKADMAVNSSEAWPADGGKADTAPAAADAGTYGQSDEAKYEMYDADDAEAVTEEAKEAFPEEEMPAEDSAPAAWRADALLGDYAAVITIYGEVPESVLAFSEGMEETPEGTAWLIPPDMAEELSAALEKSGVAYEWLSGGGETSDWLLVRSADN